MNPEVMRRKWMQEPTVTPFLEKRQRALLSKLQTSADPRIAPADAPAPEEREAR
jgi:hypothetical protein